MCLPRKFCSVIEAEKNLEDNFHAIFSLLQNKSFLPRRIKIMAQNNGLCSSSGNQISRKIRDLLVKNDRQS